MRGMMADELQHLSRDGLSVVLKDRQWLYGVVLLLTAVKAAGGMQLAVRINALYDAALRREECVLDPILKQDVKETLLAIEAGRRHYELRAKSSLAEVIDLLDSPNQTKPDAIHL